MKLELDVLIQASPERVFQATTDLANLPDYVSGINSIEVLTEGPVGVGTRFKETRTMFGKDAVEEMTFSVHEAPERFTLTAVSCGASFESTHEFVPEGSGTRMKLTMVSKPLTFMARLASPFGFLMMGSMKKAILKDLQDVKKHLEAAAEAA